MGVPSLGEHRKALIHLDRLRSSRRVREGSAHGSGCSQESLSTGAQPGFEGSELGQTGKTDVTHRHRKLVSRVGVCCLDLLPSPDREAECHLLKLTD